MMFMPDKLAAYREVRRVLRPSGRFIFTVWDRIEANPVQHVADLTVAGLFPENPPHFLARTPFGYADAARIERESREAGFTTVGTGDPAELPCAIGAGGRHGVLPGIVLRGEIEARDPHGLARATDAVTAALQERFGAKSFDAPSQALLVTAS